MKLWNAIRRWSSRVLGWDRMVSRIEATVDAAIDQTRAAQKERDALIAESFAKQGKGAQGVQRAMAVRIANAIRKGAA